MSAMVDAEISSFAVRLAGRVGCVTGATAQRGFLGALEESAADALKAQGVHRRYPRGTALFHERQEADRVLVVLTGTVKLSAVSEDGREFVLALRGPGDLLGELGALDGMPRSASAIAVDDVEALAMSVADFRAFLEQHPRAALVILEMLATRLRDADRKRVEFAAQDSMSRVAARIVELSERFGEERDGAIRIDLPISQEELAGWTGCSRDSVVKALQAMRGLGWIDTERRRITVHDLDALRRRAT
jgi:CRP/FNR family cyclic AMP-dependent transcriptional regulator